MSIWKILPFHSFRKAIREKLNASPPPPTCLCPCCGYRTLSERGEYEICPVCFWEDDGQDDEDADIVKGGPNGDLSLAQARKNYREYGAVDRRSLAYVRAPKPDELVKSNAQGTPDDGQV